MLFKQSASLMRVTQRCMAAALIQAVGFGFDDARRQPLPFPAPAQDVAYQGASQRQTVTVKKSGGHHMKHGCIPRVYVIPHIQRVLSSPYPCQQYSTKFFSHSTTAINNCSCLSMIELKFATFDNK